jgi:hypothetical protein
MKITGKLDRVFETQSGTTKAGKEWKKLLFNVVTDDEWNNLYHFELFGEEKVNSFNSKVGDFITVNFNVQTQEYKDRFYTNLQAWKIDVEQNGTGTQQPQQSMQTQDMSTSEFNGQASNDENETDLPF